MAKTPSVMIPLGETLPSFELQDCLGRTFSSEKLKGEAILVMFICNHCPYVVHVMPELLKIVKDFTKSGVEFVAINSNDISKYPDDSPEKMKDLITKLGTPFPYLFDESQEVAKSFKAACTPDFFLYNADKKLVYRGRLDSSTPGNGEPLTGVDLRNALKCLLAKKTISLDQRPSLGCNIKWKN